MFNGYIRSYSDIQEACLVVILHEEIASVGKVIGVQKFAKR